MHLHQKPAGIARELAAACTLPPQPCHTTCAATHPGLMLVCKVVVPPTFEEFTTRRVLTTGWLDGEKLSQSKEGDVAQLVNLGVVAYLKQLLDTGFFHVRPPPQSALFALEVVACSALTCVCWRPHASISCGSCNEAAWAASAPRTVA